MPAKESLQAKFIGLVNGKDPPNLHYHSSSLNTRLMWPQCYYKISFSGPASPWYPASSDWPPGWHPPPQRHEIHWTTSILTEPTSSLAPYINVFFVFSKTGWLPITQLLTHRAASLLQYGHDICLQRLLWLMRALMSNTTASTQMEVWIHISTT